MNKDNDTKLHIIDGGAVDEKNATISTEEEPSGAPNVDELAAEQEAEEEDSGKRSASKILIGFADDLEFFHTPDHVAHVNVFISERRNVWRVRSKEFKLYLRHRYYEATRKAPPAQALEDALGVLEARAEFTGAEQATHLRVGASSGHLYLDLGAGDLPFIEVRPDGWSHVPDVPVRFRRPSSLVALPPPQRGGCIDDLRQFINVDSAPMFRLFVTWLVAALFSTIPVPVLVVQGIQGSAKSTLLRIVRFLIDPAKGMLRGQPRQEHDLAIAAARSWFVSYDNLSFIPDWLSDALCRIVTGGAFAARQLYSDDDEIVFEYRRPTILNGIEELVTRSDLLDRAVVLNLPKVEETARRDEDEFWAAFEVARPAILGALLDIAVGVLRRLPTVELHRKPRMADFAKIGVAVETTVGWPSGSFMEAYTGNRGIANEIAIEASLIGPFIRELASSRHGWHGSPEALLKKLDEMYDRSRSGLPADARTPTFGSGAATSRVKPKHWPTNAQQLSAKLQRIIPNLVEGGIEVERGKTAGPQSRRFIRLGLKSTGGTGTPVADAAPTSPAAAPVPVATPVMSPMVPPSTPRCMPVVPLDGLGAAPNSCPTTTATPTIWEVRPPPMFREFVSAAAGDEPTDEDHE